MSTARRIIKNMFSLSVAEMASKGIVFLTYAYLARIILPEGMGVIAFANAMLVYFLLVVNLGYNIVGTREIAKDRKNIPQYVNAILSMRGIISIVAAIVFFLTVLFLDKPFETKIVVWIIGINLFSNAILVDWVYQGIEKMEVLAIRQVTVGVLNLVGVLLFVHGPGDTILAMSIMVTSFGINAIWMLLLYIKLYGPVRFEYNKQLWKTLTKASIPIAISNTFIVILNYLNMLMLGLMCSDAENGLYYTSFKLLLVFILPSQIINSAFFPFMARAETDEQKKNAILKYNQFLFFIGSITTLLAYTFAGYVINIVFGPEYASTVQIARYLMISALFMFFNTSLFPPLIAWNKEKYNMYAVGFGAITNVLLNLYLIPKYGAEGAALAAVFSELTVGIGLSIFFFMFLKKTFVHIFISFIAIAALCSYLAYLGHSILGLHEIPAMLGASVIYVMIIFGFRIISWQELMGYLKK